ncbi:MAG: tetratricopeptide repeat protein, partial [Rhodospirillaceae bacterium]
MDTSAPTSDELNVAFREAVGLHKAGKLHDAVRRYEALRRALPNNPQLLYLLGSAYVGLDRDADGAEALEQSLQSRPDYAPALDMAGSAWTKLGKPENALTYFERSAALTPESVGARCRLGIAMVGCRFYKQAATELQRCVELDPQHGESWHYLAIALHQQDMLGDAVHACREAIRNGRESPMLRAQLGDLLTDLGKLDEAEQELEEARERFS